MSDKIDNTLEARLQRVDYQWLNNYYVPSVEAIEFITFIKMVNGAGGEENTSPVMHLDMLDSIIAEDSNLFIAFRGSAKTSLLSEYMFLYIATYGEFFSFGEVNVGIYVSDTIDNGIKSMRKNLEHRWLNSEFLQKYIPKAKFTDTRWEFTNTAGHRLCIRGFGAATGVRGFKEYGERPTWASMDDLLSDKNASSPTITADIKDVIYKAVRQAMHPRKRKVILSGTPFNQSDPLYTAVENGMWATKVYPICEQYPCTKQEFVGAWEDRFPYEFVKNEYELLEGNGEVAAFYQELMLQIMSDEERLVLDSDIRWYDSRSQILTNKGAFNFCITTDFATSAKAKADFSVILVWAKNNKGFYFLVDGVCRRQGMGENINDLFRLCSLYDPISVGIEVSGQQGGFIPWIESEMLSRNIYFNLASDKNTNAPGIRPVTDKLTRFNTVVPWFKQGRIWLPKEMQQEDLVKEILNELRLITMTGIKSRNDDCIDCISQLSCFKVWRPSESISLTQNDDSGIWGFDIEEEFSEMDSYIV